MPPDELLLWHDDRARDYALDYATITAHRETVVALRELAALRKAARDLLDAAATLTVAGDGRGYFESGANITAVRVALSALRAVA